VQYNVYGSERLRGKAWRHSSPLDGTGTESSMVVYIFGHPPYS
jgi:hypothetical protein